MKPVLWALILGCIFAQSAVGQPAPPQTDSQETVLLAYKFTKGQLLRYKVQFDAETAIDGGPPEVPAGNEKSVMHCLATVRMRVQRVLPDGSAEFTSTFEAANVTVDGKKQSVDAKSTPVVKFIMQETGAVKWLTPARAAKGETEESPLRTALNYVTEFMLPGKEVKVGDTWDVSIKDCPIDEWKMDIPLTATLVSANSMAVGLKSAEITLKTNPEAAFIMVWGAPMTASANVEGKYYISLDRKCLMKTEGSTAINVKVFQFGGEPSDAGPPTGSETAPEPTSSTDVVMKVNYKAELLPE